MDKAEFNKEIEKRIRHALRRVSETTENALTAAGTAKMKEYMAQQRYCGILSSLTSLRGSMPKARVVQAEIEVLDAARDEASDAVSAARIEGEADVYQTYIELLSGESLDMDVERARKARKALKIAVA
jgi:hypothetical protein